MDLDDVDGLLRTFQSEAQTLMLSPSSTVAPPVDGAVGREALLALQGLTHDPRDLEDEGPLGEGGMGVVRLAKQVSLGRRVAVKYLREGRREPQDVEALLTEAWTAGHLEHPNILPIHALTMNPDGTPVIVMKRIEGVTWATLLNDPAAMEAHAPARAPLDEHLRILQQVCHALHFAHTRGVVHRDLKPENVMVGAFGEVYLVDWGLARRPGPSEQLAGTPVYMAPEMLGRPGDEISERTDVYLLGAMLFEVLTGTAPHRGATPNAIIASILESAPRLPDATPAPLADLVRACMHPDPAQRTASALEVRVELEAFASRQSSLSLTEQSEQRLEALRTLLATPAPDVTQVYAAFAAARFGFEQALSAWTANEQARLGWRSALRAMVRFEADHGTAQTARAFFAELSEPDAALQYAIDEAAAREEEQARRLKRLDKLEAELDPRTDSGVRMLVGLLISGVWIIAPLIDGHFSKDSNLEGVSSVPGALVSLGIVAVAAWQEKRRGLRSTPLNRQLMAIVGFGMAVQSLFLVARHLLVGPFGPWIVPTISAYWAVIVGVGAVSIFRPIWPTALAYALSSTASSFDLEHRYEWVAAGNLGFCLNAFLLWRRQRRP